jgi:hypothetical protein
MRTEPARCTLPVFLTSRGHRLRPTWNRGTVAHILPPLSWGACRAPFVGGIIRFLLSSPTYEHHQPTISTVLYASALRSRPRSSTTPIRHRRGSESRLESRALFALACSARGVWVLQRRMKTHVLRIPNQDPDRARPSPTPASSPFPTARATPTDVVAPPHNALRQPRARIQVRMQELGLAQG